MFTLDKIRHRYRSKEVLRIDQWEVSRGEQWLVLGPSGSGKTTLLHILAGVLLPTEGSVSIAGQHLEALQASQLDRFRGRNIGIVFQRLYLIPSLTVLQNLLLAQYLAGSKRDLSAAHALLDNLSLSDQAHRMPAALSFGQSQRAALARALINRPSLILADEPTSSLDDGNATAALDLLMSQARLFNATLVIATHDRRIENRIERKINLEERV